MDKLNLQVVLDGMGQGILLFASDGKLELHNRAAGRILGTDLNLIRDQGWEAAVALFNTGLKNPEDMVTAIRDQALESENPVRFRIYRQGEYVPCWAAAISGEDGSIYLLITIDVPDWSMVTDVIDRFRKEMSDAVNSTLGHINLINKTIDSQGDTDEDRKLGKRIGGFTRLITIHMDRANRLMQMLTRLEAIRLGQVYAQVKKDHRGINLEEYFEDFVEELDEIDLLDPETEKQDIRGRVEVNLKGELAIAASRRYLTYSLHDILRNAVMYSLRGTPITIEASPKGKNIQIDVKDEGYGIRKKEWERIFAPFERGRQPQVIGEFGYGLSLHLCKQEISAMQGTLWFTSEESVGTTFSILLPQWQEQVTTE